MKKNIKNKQEKDCCSSACSTPTRRQLEELISQWKSCLMFLPHGESIGYKECIEELQQILNGDSSPIDKW